MDGIKLTLYKVLARMAWRRTGNAFKTNGDKLVTFERKIALERTDEKRPRMMRTVMRTNRELYGETKSSISK